MQQPSVSQQPIQFQNIAGPGQTFVNGNPQPALQQHVQLQNITEQGQTSFIANPPPPYYEEKLYLQDPTKMAYATLPMQPYPTYNMPQPYGGNYYSTPQQVYVIPMHKAVYILFIKFLAYMNVLLIFPITARHSDPTATNCSPS